MTNDRLFAVLAHVLGPGPWPTGARFLDGIRRVAAGGKIEDVARAVRTTPAKLRSIVLHPDPVAAALGRRADDISAKDRQKSRLILGQLLLGRAAEAAFESLYRQEIQSQALDLRDVRVGRTDTDYRVYDEVGRKLFRINIKFHGSQFRRAPELVGLDPEDSFALATCKIASALEKQEKEGLPYFFTIVGVPGLTADAVGGGLPPELIDLVALFHASSIPRKRDLEEAVVEHLISFGLPAFETTFAAILAAEWYVLSARKADLLLREHLFSRVYALRIRNFARAFPGAEIDMHFSLRQDLVPLHDFLRVLRDEGLAKVSTLLERGLI